jgi:hypothetical protein
MTFTVCNRVIFQADEEDEPVAVYAQLPVCGEVKEARPGRAEPEIV